MFSDASVITDWWANQADQIGKWLGKHTGPEILNEQQAESEDVEQFWNHK